MMGGVLNYLLALIYMHSWVGIVEFHASKQRFQVFSMWISTIQLLDFRGCIVFHILFNVL